MPTDWSVGLAVIGQVEKEHPTLFDAIRSELLSDR